MLVLIIGVCGSLTLAACGGSATSSGEPGPEAARDADPATSTPVVDPVPGNPPKKLVIVDLREGSGKKVGAGDEVSIRFLMLRYAPREHVDSNRQGAPRRFELGAGAEIPGWERGLRGMRAGGRRKLIVPPRLVFPESGPEDTMVYVVDLLEAN